MAHLSLHMSKCHIVGNLMHWLISEINFEELTFNGLSAESKISAIFHLHIATVQHIWPGVNYLSKALYTVEPVLSG